MKIIASSELSKIALSVCCMLVHIMHNILDSRNIYFFLTLTKNALWFLWQFLRGKTVTCMWELQYRLHIKAMKICKSINLGSQIMFISYWYPLGGWRTGDRNHSYCGKNCQRHDGRHYKELQHFLCTWFTCWICLYVHKTSCVLLVLEYQNLYCNCNI